MPLITNQNIDRCYSFTHGWQSIYRYMMVSSFITLYQHYTKYTFIIKENIDITLGDPQRQLSAVMLLIIQHT